MPPRTLASLAHALNTARDLDGALVALAEALAELDRSAYVALIRYDGRRRMMMDRHLARPDSVDMVGIETTFDHLPSRERALVATGGGVAEFRARSGQSGA